MIARDLVFVSERADCIELKALSVDSEYEESILFDAQGISRVSSRGKGVMPLHLVAHVSFGVEENYPFGVTVCMKADDEWNLSSRRQHPIRYALGLIVKYDAYQVFLGSFACSGDLGKFQGFIANLGYPITITNDLGG